MAVSLSRNERVFLQLQSALNTLPNSGGSATVAVANYARHRKITLTPSVAMLVRPDKTGTRTATQGVAGRRSATWSCEASLVGSGTAGTAPPHAPIYAALMGQAGSVISGSGAITGATNAAPIVVTQTGHGFANDDVVYISNVGGNTAANGVWVIKNITANTYELAGSTGSAAYTSGGTGSRASVRYSLSDSILGFAAYVFRTPAALQQRVSIGSVVSQAQFQLGQDVADFSASGDSFWIGDSDTHSGADAEAKAALTTFPVEPVGTLPSDGGIIAGFTGRAVVNGATTATIRQATVNINTGNAMVRDTFGTYYADADGEGDERSVTASFSIYDNDSAAARTLYQRGLDKQPIEIILQIGTVPGNILVAHLKGVQLNTGGLDDGQRRMVRAYSDCRAYGSGPGNLDEVRLTWI